jgi:hypothetical protein
MEGGREGGREREREGGRERDPGCELLENKIANQERESVISNYSRII